MRSTFNAMGAGVVVSLMWIVAGTAIAEPARPPSEPTLAEVEVTAELQRLTDAYFSTPHPEERKDLVRLIEVAANHDAYAVAKALKNVDAWSATRPGPVNMYFPGPGRPTAAAVFEIPLGYTSDRAYPMVVCIPDSGLEPEVMLAQARLYLGDHVNEFIVAATTAEIAGTFQQQSSDRGKLRTLVKMLRKRLHTDTQRLYVLGVGTGADAAWLAAIRNPDLFAGVIAVNGYPKVPYPQQAYPMLLQSLRDVNVLSVWDSSILVSGPDLERVVAVAKHNKAIARLAAKMSLPLRIIESATESVEHRPPLDAISEIVTRDRVTIPKTIERWFRYPEHGRSAWLRQKRFAGDVWDESAMSIATGAATDRNAFVTSVLREKMAHVGGTIEGQTVTLQVSRTAGVVLMLPLGALDPAQKVTVICNGRTRHDSRLPPAIDTLLEDAYERWEFVAPAAVRLALSVKSGN